MAIPLETWLKSEEFKEIADAPLKEFSEYLFFRNPLRNITVDDRFLKAPSDGILLYQGKYQANQKIVEVKGKKYTVRDILDDDTIPKEKKFYVFGIYLTSFSVHVVRTMTKGVILEIRNLLPILSNNFPMVLFESELLRNNPNFNFMQFSFLNQRTIVMQYSPVLRTRIYYVLIADAEVDKNLLFVGEDEAVSQAQRLAYVLFGSQLDVVIEAQDWFRLRKLVPNFYYIYAGLDDLYRVYFRYPYKVY
ncbi:MAG: hypothetical protein DRP34_03390 [Thermodesulfobacteriota bacterium]|nr:MAG: hypothetical protein DRP34_03390 [Thermodesulfobacteriota bacterium]